MNDILEKIRIIDPDIITSKPFDECLDKMKNKYRFNIENMKHEIKQLEQEIDQKKIEIGTDEYNKRILSILGNPSVFH